MENYEDASVSRNNQLFQPSLWMQRRSHVRSLLEDISFPSADTGDLMIESVMDVGCGEGRMMEFLANDCRIRRLIGVDLLRDRLDIAKVSLMPTESDRIMLRESPLVIELYHGPITSVISKDDSCNSTGGSGKSLVDCVVCSEVIEHVPVNEVDEFSRCLFEKIAPRVIIITTPNSEFNCKFPERQDKDCTGCGDNVDGMDGGNATLNRFRDADHKFEWTRSEFQEWCDRCCRDYGYRLDRFGGVGTFSGEDYDETFGFCTQSARFIKNQSLSKSAWLISADCLVARIEYPFFDASLVTNEQIVNFLQSRSSIQPLLPKWKLLPSEQKDNNSKSGVDDGDSVRIHLHDLWLSNFRLRQLCQGRIFKLVEILQSSSTVSYNASDKVVGFSFPPIRPNPRQSNETSSDSYSKRSRKEPKNSNSKESNWNRVKNSGELKHLGW